MWIHYLNAGDYCINDLIYGERVSFGSNGFRGIHCNQKILIVLLVGSVDGDCIGQGVDGEAGVDDSTYIRNVNTTEQSPAAGVAFVTVRLSDGRLGHQPKVVRSASSELQKTVEELKSTVVREKEIIAQQQKGMEAVTARLDEQAAQIQKVSAQLAAASPSRGGLEVSKPALQVVNNP